MTLLDAIPARHSVRAYTDRPIPPEAAEQLRAELQADNQDVYKRQDLDRTVTEQVEITLKYAGYIERQNRQVAEMKKLEERTLPQELDYASIQGLRLEARQKLAQIRPLNLGQASRISGVSPADVAALMVYLKN